MSLNIFVVCIFKCIFMQMLFVLRRMNLKYVYIIISEQLSCFTKAKDSICSLNK